MINGQPRYFQGDLLLWTGDTLASRSIAGFKEGVGGALRFCRNCMATREESNVNVCYPTPNVTIFNLCVLVL